MSNCIEIEQRGKVRFEPWEIDARGLKALIERAEVEVNGENSMSDEVDWKLRIAWWYLSINTQFKRSGAVEIQFGEGRSSHTWRDIRGTFKLLSEFVKLPKYHGFICSDESDGHETWFRMVVDLQSPKL